MRHALIAHILLLLLLAPGAPARAQDLQVQYTAGYLELVGQTPSPSLTVTSLDTGLMVSSLDGVVRGGQWFLGAMPPFVALAPTRAVQSIGGDFRGANPPPTGWSSFISDGQGRAVAELFWTWGEGDMVLVLPKPPGSSESLAVVVQDRTDDDDTQVLTEGLALVSNSRFAAFRVADLDDDLLELRLNAPGSVQLLGSFESRTGWAVSPVSLQLGETGHGLLSWTVVAAQRSLIVVALEDDTEVSIVDLTDSDDSHQLTMDADTIFTTIPGTDGEVRLEWDVVEAGGELDRDLVEVRASKPVLVFVGAFEEDSGRGLSTVSTPIGPGRHVTLLSVKPGALHLASGSPAEATVTPLLTTRGPLQQSDRVVASDWLGVGPYYVEATRTTTEQLILVEASAPFAAVTVPYNTARCCGPWVTPSFEQGPDLLPVAEAGRRQEVCPGEVFTLSGVGSFDADQRGPAPWIVAWTWDLDLEQNSDGQGGADDDFDDEGVEVTHRYMTSGRRWAQLTVEDNEGQRDDDAVEIQVRVPVDPACGGDADADGFGAIHDNCPEVSNPVQTDTDGDGIGDLCDSDLDGDGVANDIDLCPQDPDPGQEDIDLDRLGDACDPDRDGDGVANAFDNCPSTFNRSQEDTDNDRQGDLCDPDLDGDSHANPFDNCPTVPNRNQVDTDGDTLGDLCDDDDDDDGVPDATDNCISDYNPNQADRDGNGLGDACDPDIDRDGVSDNSDNCPRVPNPSQADIDGDRLGDACDPDRDGDDVPNTDDNCPSDYNPDQRDGDGNGTGDACEPDGDGDGVADFIDNCWQQPNPSQADTDSDGLGDACDPDIDDDGLSNDQERGLGTLINDPDSDSDGLQDGVEIVLSTNPLLWDSDDDNLSDGDEVRARTDPLSPDTDSDGVADGVEPGWDEDSDRDGLINARDFDSDNGGVDDGTELLQGRDMLDPTDDLRDPLPPPVVEGGARCSASPAAASPALWWVALALLVALRPRRGR